MMKRISTTALLLTFALVAGCQGQGDSNDNPAPGADPATPAAPAARAAEVKPLEAVFTQATFTTVYTAEITNPDSDELAFAWSGPACGAFSADTVTCQGAKCTSRFSWMHGSPACPEHSSHDDTTIVLQAVGKRSGRTVVCTYKGSDTGKGPNCYQNGFNGTEIGSPETNHAFVRYHLPLGKQCSKVDLIQVMSIVKKSSGTVVPNHLDGIDVPEGMNPFYEPPAAADDAGGYVVDKFLLGISSNDPKDPYYGGSVSGSRTQDATLDDRPGNTREGHVARFDVCAFCSGNPTDAEYGKYLDCFRWEHDGDTKEAKKSDPQPTQKPSPEFEAAVAKWNQNKGFTMPAAPQK